MNIIQIQEMKLELKALDNKTNWNNVICKHQTNYLNLKIKFETIKEKAQRRDIYYDYDIKKQAMLQQTKQNTNILKDAQQQLNKTELNALDTMDTLNDQTEQIKDIQQKVQQSNNLLDNMGNTIKKMKRRWWA